MNWITICAQEIYKNLNMIQKMAKEEKKNYKLNV